MSNSMNPFTAPKCDWSHDAVAADVTTLLAASSFVKPFSGLRDPRADYLFEIVTTDYCNGCKLILPLPRDTPGHGAFFVDLWAADSAVKTLTDSEMTDSEFHEVAKLLAPGLAVYLEGATSAAQWVAFQFTPENVGCHMSRADDHSIFRAGPLAQELISNGSLNSFKPPCVAQPSNRQAPMPTMPGPARSLQRSTSASPT